MCHPTLENSHNNLRQIARCNFLAGYHRATTPVASVARRPLREPPLPLKTLFWRAFRNNREDSSRIVFKSERW